MQKIPCLVLTFLLSIPAFAAPSDKLNPATIFAVQGFITGYYSTREEAEATAEAIVRGAISTNWKTSEVEDSDTFIANGTYILDSLDQNKWGESIATFSKSQKNLSIFISAMESVYTKMEYKKADIKFRAMSASVGILVMIYLIQYLGDHGVSFRNQEFYTSTQTIEHLLITFATIFGIPTLTYLAGKYIIESPSERLPPKKLGKKATNFLLRLQKAKSDYCTQWYLEV